MDDDDDDDDDDEITIPNSLSVITSSTGADSLCGRSVKHCFPCF